MARQYNISTHAVTMVANVAKTVIEIPTSATAPFLVVSLEVMSRATSAGHLIIEWGTFTTTGTGATVTPNKWGSDQGVAAVLGTVKIIDTVEPAGFAVGALPSWSIPLPGMYSFFYPYGREFFQPAGVNRALRLTSSLAFPTETDLVIEQ